MPSVHGGSKKGQYPFYPYTHHPGELTSFPKETALDALIPVVEGVGHAGRQGDLLCRYIIADRRWRSATGGTSRRRVHIGDVTCKATQRTAKTEVHP